MYKIPRTPRRQMALSLQLIADEFDNLLWSFDIESRNQARFFCFHPRRDTGAGRALRPAGRGRLSL